MILFKLGILIVFILFAVSVIRVGVRLIKEADDIDVKEKMNDIELKAKRVDTVDEYVETHGEDIEKSQSGSVTEFISE